MSTLDADAAFSRLEEMIASLPRIQDRDKLLLRAREARNLLTLDKRACLLQAEMARYERVFDAALLDAKAASDAGNEEAESENLSIVRAYSELKYTRLGAVQHSENELRRALEASELTLDDPLTEYALSDADYQALENEVTAFQEEYRAVYEYCLSLEE